MSNTSYEFRYLKKTHDIEINTFLISQQSFFTILNEINRVSLPDTSIKIKLSQPRPGSFIIDHFIKLLTVGMFAHQNIVQISTLFDVLKDFLEIWKLLKGEKAENASHSANSVNIIVKGDNNTFHPDAFKIYPHQ